MIQLPLWRLTNKFPSFYDTESGSSIEMTAKVYGAMRELIDEYNKFVSDINIELSKFEADITKDNCEFKNSITEIVENHIKCVDMKMNTFTRETNMMIDEAVKYMKTNITATTIAIINKALADGSISVGLVYNPTSEEINLITQGGVE